MSRRDSASVPAKAGAPDKPKARRAKKPPKFRDPTEKNKRPPRADNPNREQAIAALSKTMGKSAIRYTKEQRREHEQTIERLILQHATEPQIAVVCRERFGFGLFRVKKLQKAIYERWAEEDKEMRRHNKAIAVRELQDAMRIAHVGVKKKIRKKLVNPDTGKLEWATIEVWDIRPNLSAFRGLAELKARIQGTLAPLEVSMSVQVHDALTNIMSNLEGDEVQSMLQEYQETMALAEQARAQGMLPPASPVTESAAE